MTTERRPDARSWFRRYLPWPTLLILALAAYILFWGQTSLPNRLAYEHTIDSLRMELKAQEDTMIYYRDLNERLSKDPEVMEHVVREQYNMKREHEDVYIVEKKDKK